MSRWTTDDAAAAVAEMQLRVDKSGAASGAKLRLRIGFHYGPVVDQEQDSDVFSDTVNLASRLCDLASRGQIIIGRPCEQALQVVEFSVAETWRLGAKN